MAEEKHIDANNIELRSEEVRDIMSRPPSWMVRWGSTIVLFVIGVLLFLSWLIKYPDVIHGEIILDSLNPPVELVSKVSGRIQKLTCTNQQLTEKGTVLAILENNAKDSAVYALDSVVEKINIQGFDAGIRLDKMLQLGEIQPEYSAFVVALENYNLYKRSNPEARSISHVQGQIQTAQGATSALEQQAATKLQQYKMLEEKLQRDENLFRRGIIAKQDVDNTRNALLQTKYELQSMSSSLYSNASRTQDYQKQIDDYSSTSVVKTSDKALDLVQKFNLLQEKIKWWKSTYIITAPCSGKINFSKPWSTELYIQENTTVFSIIPQTDSVVGHVEVPMQNFGKIQLGQRVNIRLLGFPDREYGILVGKVKDISLVPTKDKKYQLTVDFPNGLTTTYKKQLKFTQQMIGSADVVTEEKRVIERIFDNLRYLTKREIN